MKYSITKQYVIRYEIEEPHEDFSEFFILKDIYILKYTEENMVIYKDRKSYKTFCYCLNKNNKIQKTYSPISDYAIVKKDTLFEFDTDADALLYSEVIE